MLRLIISILLVVLGTSAFAQATVQTGDHPNFTRLAVNFPVGTGWEITEIDGGYDLTLDQVDFKNLDGFFDIISRERVSEATIIDPNNTLRIVTACSCGFSAELWRPNWLIVDILDQTLDDIGNTNIDVDEPTTAVETYFPDPPVVEPTIAPITLPVLFTDTETIVPKAQLSLEGVATSATEGAANAFEAVILESLRRGSSQGIVNLGAGLDLGLPSSIGASSVNEDAPGLSAMTSLENANVIAGDPPPKAEALNCIPNTSLNISSWGDDRPFSVQIAEDRRLLTGEFDEISEEAVQKLARRYLFFGFGKEAQAVLETGGVRSQSRNVLKAIAQIVDDEPLTDAGFATQVSCETNAAMWALIAQEGKIDGRHGSVENMVLAFKDLPRDLQELLGTRFSEALRNIGKSEMAKTLLARATEDPEKTIEVSIESASIELDMGNLRAATQTLSQLAERDQRMTPEALLLLIDARIENDSSVTNEELSLLETMIFQFRETELRAELEFAQVRAQLQNGQYESSLTLLEQVVPRLSATQGADAYNTILRRVSTDANDSDFLRIAFADVVFEAEEEVVNLFAKRLMTLGFLDRASTLLVDSRNPIIESERARLRSEILARAALREVPQNAENIEQNEVAIAEPIEANPQAQNDPLESWRNSDWSKLRDSQDDLLKRAADRRLNDRIEASEDEATIAAADALLSSSESLRDTIGSLLERFDDVDAQN